MLPRNPIWRFVLTFCVLYALGAAPWPGLQACYSAAYRGVGNALFGEFGKRVVDETGHVVRPGRVSFHEAPNPDRTSDTIISTQRVGRPEIGDADHSPRLAGYLPTIEFMALALATPIAWRRRLVGLAVGTLLMQFFVVFRVLIALLYWFSTPGMPWRLYEWRPLVWKTLTLAQEAINVAPVASFVVPALLWLILLFRPADWTEALGALAPALGGTDESNASAETGPKSS